ncbi:GntR family transcriptional regulator [Allofranklinella schreckenbergeri]|uniref:GntR family transcriptional regulator n=1 Tax=Allofranklinella schreckenbergeri TaxID=1076744 RepID=A0A3M6QVY1_9BURK|nr:GntR family transcriptional regulator [Allofranklinella schreckenbergeri]MDO4706414.1 GntR family transcriptional regulator [Comamonadaceae bacterium]RMX07165.1 GntR family transcriptional regulator [Allofranklinella schreckenbergeri]
MPAASPPPQLARRALYEDVADWLRQRIANRVLKPGDWIDEVAIATELGISRTPLREALKVLAAEGLITMKMRRGAYVAETNEEDLQEVYEMLSLLEADAAAFVAAHASPVQYEELQRIHEWLESNAHNPDAFFKANEEFHVRLLEMAANRWRQQMVADLRKVMKLRRHSSLLRQGRIAQSLQEHRAIMKALQEKDPDAARRSMAQHIMKGLDAARPSLGE